MEDVAVTLKRVNFKRILWIDIFSVSFKLGSCNVVALRHQAITWTSVGQDPGARH